jgi:excisionase family DNA binding protein
MTTKEAADLLGIKPRSVVQRIRRGTLKATKKGRDYDIDPDELEKIKKP